MTRSREIGANRRPVRENKLHYETLAASEVRLAPDIDGQSAKTIRLTRTIYYRTGYSATWWLVGLGVYNST